MNKKQFTKGLFDKSRHREILTDYQKFTYDRITTTILRRDYLHLIFTRSEKYYTVLKNVLEEDKYGQGTKWKHVDARFPALYKALLVEPDTATPVAWLKQAVSEVG